jgi:ribulose-bisphosphate carboxylase large chain
MERIPDMWNAYGDHVIYLIGGALLREPELITACQALRAGIAGAATGAGKRRPTA